MPKYIFILGSLDTKGEEIDFLRKRVLESGGLPLVVDTGVLGEATIPADITRHQVADAGGSTIQALIQKGDKTHALLVMAQGAAAILQFYLARGEVGGVLSIGGSRGTALSTRAMQALPVGIPKLMVSTIASGHNTFAPYVGIKDITMMHSVADVQGINAVTRPIFTNAAAAIVAMSRVGKPVQRTDRHVFTASMLGASTPLVAEIQKLMTPLSSEVIAFHAVGTGGRAMEDLISQKLVEGVFDVTTGEIIQEIVHSKFSAGNGRLLAASRLGIPQVVAPGGMDFIITGPADELPGAYKARKWMSHTPTITLVRTTAEELSIAARQIAERLAKAKAPVLMILPKDGFGLFDVEGKPLYDPKADKAFADTFKQHASANVQIVEMDTHLNDPQVGKLAVDWMKDVLSLGEG